MKKRIISLVSALSLAALSLNAQTPGTASTTVGGTTFGIRAGVNFQNINGKDINDDKLENDLKTGFNVGVNAEIPLAPEFYLQPGVLFSTKGTKFENTDNKLNLSYIEVPINFLYKPVLGSGKLLLGFGPYAAFAIGGKIKNGNTDVDVEFDSEVDFANSIAAPTYKRFDAGANFLVGYELSNNLSLQLNAQLGLLDISPDYTNAPSNADNIKYKNTGFGLSLGYRF